MSGPAGQAPSATRARRNRLLERWGERSPAEAALTLLWLIPLGLAAVYLVLFLARLPQNIADILWDSDYASGFTLTQSVAQAGDGGHTVISTTGAYLPLWFGLLTAHLPFHRQLWEIAPTLLTGVTALTIGWSVAQVASRRAGVLAVLIVLVASPWTLAILMAPVAHNTVYPVTALLGAYLLWLARDGTRQRNTTIAVALLGALVLGAAIASDALVIVTGVAARSSLSGVLAASSRAVARGAVALACAGERHRLGSDRVHHSGDHEGSGLCDRAVTAAARTRVALEPAEACSHSRGRPEGTVQRLSGCSWPGKLHAEVGIACDVVLVSALLTLLYYGSRSSVRLMRRRREDGDPDLRPTAPHRVLVQLSHRRMWRIPIHHCSGHGYAET